MILEYVAEKTSTLIERLDAAGAILLGKMNTWEYGTGTGEIFEDLPFPLARNPWNTEHFTGGSSTGVGVGVAAGTAVFGLGSDTGGSIRLPAAATGVVGMKATYGLLRRAGCLPNYWSLDVIVLEAVAGSDPRDPQSADVAAGSYRAGIATMLLSILLGIRVLARTRPRIEGCRGRGNCLD